MDARNIEHFKVENPEAQFPHYRSLTSLETERIRSRLKTLIGLPDGVDNLSFVKKLAELSKAGKLNVDDAEFSLSTIFRRLEISPKDKVYINFYRFDLVDEMSLCDVVRYFNFIWYPGSDDIDIFDESLRWILSISHDGNIHSLVLAI